MIVTVKTINPVSVEVLLHMKSDKRVGLLDTIRNSALCGTKLGQNNADSSLSCSKGYLLSEHTMGVNWYVSAEFVITRQQVITTVRLYCLATGV